MTPDEAKEAAAREALKHVRDGMKLGLGTGSTAAKFVAGLGEMVAGGLNVVCVPTSEATRQQAESLNIPLTRLDEEPILDLTVDGADELDANLTLIKGGGGALLREKIVASSSKQMIVIADDTKKVDMLGKFPLPIEVVPFGVKSTAMKIEHASRWAGCEGPLALRIRDEELFVTDNGNVIIDCAFDQIPDAQKLASALSTIPGLVDHGLFIDMAGLAILGGPNGIEIIERKSA
ncbi:MAG: ribose-5-phosphate isomerase RpiA [Anderseniella sp.]|jgi:ribose 5-phosphate isomerase A|nr:ribose-5-phosphate isomerase RpiA [Anderseniella sp.]